MSQRDVEMEKRLKKDLKRTKVLLADAQIMLDHMKSIAPSRREIAQLKNQVHHCYKLSYVSVTTSALRCVWSICLIVARPTFVLHLPVSFVLPQLEESEFTCVAAVKARKGMEIEIEDMHIQMDDVVKTKMAVSLTGAQISVVSYCVGTEGVIYDVEWNDSNS